MKGFLKSIRIVLAFVFVFGTSIKVYGKNPKRPKSHLAESITEAMKRSNSEQDRLRDRMNDEADKRIDSWRDSQTETIEIKYTGSSLAEPVDLGNANFTIEHTGEDQSGLDQWHGNVDEDATDVNFEQELRDVSSMKD